MDDYDNSIVTTRTAPGRGSQPGIGGGPTHPLGWIDPRDQPAGNSAGEADPSPFGRPSPETVPVTRMAPVRTAPALGRIITAGFVDIPAADTNGHLVGLDPSIMQGHNIAYILLAITGGACSIAGDQSATPGGRAPFPAGTSLAMEHVSGCYAWGDGAGTVRVAYIVVGL